MSMAIRKIKGKWHVDFRLERKRYRLKSPEDSKRGAEAYEALLRRKYTSGEPLMSQPEPTVASLSYSEYIEEWLTVYVDANNKPSEKKKKRSILNAHILAFFGDMKLDRIDSLSVERFKSKKLATGLSPKTINNHLTVLRKSLSCAKDWGYVDRIPVIKWLKSAPSKINTLTKREKDKLTSDEKDPLWNLMIVTGLKTGMRVGELMSLHWSEVDFEEQHICVRYSLSDKEISSTKNNRIRYIPMNSELFMLLRNWKKKTRGKQKELVFGKGSKPFSRFSSYDALHRICDRTGVRRIGWHILRHTFATELCARAVPLRAVQKLLGHSTILMTERYAHVGEQTLRNAVAVLEGEFITFGQYMGSDQKRELISARSWSGTGSRKG